MQILRKTEEIIYPSSNAHPTLFRLSETDQLPFAVPVLYFFKQGPASSQALKSSLSKTLTFFYPLAGRLVQRTEETAYTRRETSGGGDGVVKLEGMCREAIGGSGGMCDNAMGETTEENGGTCKVAIGGRVDVSCLDQGAMFCEVWAEERLETYGPDFQPHPHFDFLLVPGHDDFPLRIQMTHFLCGGVCLCVQVHHSVLDGAAIAHFLKSWAEIMNGEEAPCICPYLSQVPLEVRYGPEVEFHNTLNIDDYSRYYQPLPSMPPRELVSNRIFHLSPQFIDNLKSTTSNEKYKYTSFECIFAFISKNLTLARGISPDEEVCLYYPVNGRGRLVPPLPSSYFGNVVFETHATMKAGDLVKKPLSYTTHLLRKATSKVTNAHMRSVLNWSTRQPFPMLLQVERSSPHIFWNQWTSYPLLDFNFGWGKPLCLRINICPFDNGMILPSPLGRGYVDVFVALNKEHMGKFDSLMSKESI